MLPHPDQEIDNLVIELMAARLRGNLSQAIFAMSQMYPPQVGEAILERAKGVMNNPNDNIQFVRAAIARVYGEENADYLTANWMIESVCKKPQGKSTPGPAMVAVQWAFGLNVPMIVIFAEGAARRPEDIYQLVNYN